MTFRFASSMILSLAFVAMSSSIVHAGLLSFGDNPAVMQSLNSASEAELPKGSPPFERYFHQQIDLCEPGGVSVPNPQVSNSGNAGGIVNSQIVAAIPKSQVTTKLSLAADYALPLPIANGLFRPPEIANFRLKSSCSFAFHTSFKRGLSNV